MNETYHLGVSANRKLKTYHLLVHMTIRCICHEKIKDTLVREGNVPFIMYIAHSDVFTVHAMERERERVQLTWLEVERNLVYKNTVIQIVIFSIIS